MAGIKSVVNGAFVERLHALANSGRNSIIFPGQESPSSTSSLGAGLRLGAKTFASAVQHINSAASIINLSEETLRSLGSVVDKMIVLASESSRRGTGQAHRDTLNTQFAALGNKFRQIVEKSTLEDVDYLSKDGLASLFEEIGLNAENSSSIAEVFGRFILSSTDNQLASEYVRGSRPFSVSASLYTTEPSDSAYTMKRLTDSGIYGGMITSQGAIFTDYDDILYQNPGFDSLFSIDSLGGVSSFSQGTLTGNIDSILAVEEQLGYALVTSSSDPLGYNGSGVSQVFLVDRSGNFLQQYTNFTTSQTIAGADLSEDALRVAVSSFDGSSSSVEVIDVGSLGSDPSSMGVQRQTIESLGVGFYAYQNIKIDNAGTHVAYYDFFESRLNLWDVSTITSPVEDLTIDGDGSGTSAFGFTGSGELAVARVDSVESEFDLVRYTYSDGAYTLLVDDIDINLGGNQTFAALESDADFGSANGYISVVGSDTVHLYRDTGDQIMALDLPGLGAVLSQSNLAYRSDGSVDIGMAGTFAGFSSSFELYRISANPHATYGRRLARSTTDPTELFDDDQSIATQTDALRVLSDLKALKEQISGNIKALGETRGMVQKNIELVRETGRALLEISDQLTSDDDAESVAEKLRALIRENATAALAQAENLDAVLVATLAAAG